MTAKNKTSRGTLRWGRWVRDGLILALLMFFASKWQTKDMLDTDSSVVIAPFSLPLVDGGSQRMGPGSGKATLLYFFAPWCEICKASISNLEYVDSKRFNVYRIALDYKNVNEVKAFKALSDIEGPILLGDEGLKDTFKVQGYPTYYLLNEKFVIKASSMGYSSAAGLKMRTWVTAQEAEQVE
ncbi:TlpA family protein disulfide reductase [Alteromonas pelagimontana]|uniref:TlpA family protein disulfide reductase n=1 Tax=Alteromonas pelagimontana TaxID=1858656 RepID=A0A6M4MIJ5_9ALTE|nr:TlpA disulfide reductase family protein [Alteromonas pelagimontana]QJR82445.1 TlpA family protein disulfide reductase [Alteromonas pelagimontana]